MNQDQMNKIWALVNNNHPWVDQEEVDLLMKIQE